MTQPLILLTGYAAKQCARRVHNEWDPTIESVLWQTPPELQMRFDAGIAFEADVFATLEAELGAERCRNLTNIAGKSATIAATLEAMDQGVEVVLGGWLPDDVLGGRAGKPDILLRHSQVEGAWTYVPGDVKAHQTSTKRARGTLRYSRPAQPQLVEELPGHAAQTSSRLDDHLQLAHYWRMLQACGRAPEERDAPGIHHRHGPAGRPRAASVWSWSGSTWQLRHSRPTHAPAAPPSAQRWSATTTSRVSDSRSPGWRPRELVERTTPCPWSSRSSRTSATRAPGTTTAEA